MEHAAGRQVVIHAETGGRCRGRYSSPVDDPVAHAIPGRLVEAAKARPASSEKRLGTVVPPGMTGSRLAASMHSRSSCDQEATADVVDPRRRSWLADGHFLDQRLKGSELSIDLAKRAFGLQLEPGSE